MNVYLAGQIFIPLLVAVAVIFFGIGREWARIFPRKAKLICPFGAECQTCNSSFTSGAVGHVKIVSTVSFADAGYVTLQA